MWYIYCIAVLIIVAVWVIKYPHHFAYWVIGQIKSDNNSRWWALLILIALFGVSALLAGLGEPLLARSSRDAKTVLAEKARQNSGTVEFLKSLWRGTNAPPVAVLAPSAGKTPEKSYPSWWHWIIVMVLALAWAVYAPFAFSDETKRLIAKALKKLKKKAVLDHVRTSFGSSPPASGPTSTTGESFWKRIFREKGFTFHSLVEIIWEIIPRWFGIK